MELIGYIRVSRVAGREGDSFISPTTQRERVQAYVDAHQHKVIDWIEELDVSGGTMSRAGLQDAIRRCEAGEAQGIIVAKLDRFSRSLAGALAAIEQLQASGAQLISVADNIDSTTPTGRLMRDFMLSIAQWYRETTKEGWATSRENAIRRGVHISSHPPTGYTRGPHGLLIDPKAAPAIREAFHMRARGTTYREIAEMLDQKKVRGPATREQKRWTEGSVQKILQNRAYMGEARSGEYVNSDAHAAIITTAEYEAAQGVRTQAPSPIGDGQLLSGILRCAGCRYCLQPDSMNDRGKKRRLYRCRPDRKASGRCGEPAYALSTVIEPYVVAAFLDALSGGLTATQVGDDAAVAEAEKRVHSAEAELSEYLTYVKVGDVGGSAYQEGLKARQQEIDEARASLGAYARGTTSLPPKDIVDVWPTLPTGEQRVLLASAIDCVFLRRGKGNIASRVRILWHGEAPSDLPSRGRVVPLASFVWEDDPAPAVSLAQ